MKTLEQLKAKYEAVDDKNIDSLVAEAQMDLEELWTHFAESGADREMDFCPERDPRHEVLTNFIEKYDENL